MTASRAFRTDASGLKLFARWGPAMMLAAMALVAVLGATWLMTLSRPLDDAYISFRYAQNFARGHGLVFNIGERVEGYSCFLWVILLSGLIRLGADLELWSRLIGIACYVTTGLLTYLAVRDGLRLSRWAAVCAAAMVLLQPQFTFWAISGMETTPFAALVALGMWLCLTERSAVLCGAVLALGAMTRPEGIVYLAGLCLGALVVRPRQWRRVWVVGISFALLFLPYFAWRWSYYGFPLPNTFYNKVGGEWDRLWRGWAYARQFLAAGGLGLCVLALTGLAGPQRRVAWPVYGVVGLAAAGVVYEGGDVFGLGRFFVPLFSVLAMAAAGGLEFLWLQSRWPFHAGRIAALGAATLVLVPSLTCVDSARKQAIGMGSFYGMTSGIADRLNQVAHPDDAVALVAIGAVGYLTGVRVIDMVGLTDTTVAHTWVPGIGAGLPGHERFNSAYVLSRKPRFIVMGGPDGSKASVPAVRDMWFNPIFRREYEWIGFVFRRKEQVGDAQSLP